VQQARQGGCFHAGGLTSINIDEKKMDIASKLPAHLQLKVLGMLDDKVCSTFMHLSSYLIVCSAHAALELPHTGHISILRGTQRFFSHRLA
jgi:hypothetical protein